MSTERINELSLRLADLGVQPEDLVERFTRARGPGGQHVNRTASAVQLTYLPDGITVRAEGQRSQLQNRIAAREQLIERLETARAEKEAAAVAARERRRRQRRRPSPAARRRNVDSKRKRGTVKRQRGRVKSEE